MDGGVGLRAFGREVLAFCREDSRGNSRGSPDTGDTRIAGGALAECMVVHTRTVQYRV